MYYYKISKYNPEFRNKEGHYKKNEWTEFFQVGQTFDGNKLTYEDYKTVEDSYVSFLFGVLEVFKVEKLTLSGIKISEKDIGDNFIFFKKAFFQKFIDCIESKKLKDISYNSLAADINGKIQEFSYYRPEWEEYGFFTLKDSLEIGRYTFDSIIRLMLRGIWSPGILKSKEITIKFGWDFYVT